jgi:hypothetical protein
MRRPRQLFACFAATAARGPAAFSFPGLARSYWHRRKHGYVRRLQRRVFNGIAVARARSSSMISNTCCTTLLMQGAPSVKVAGSPT